MLVGKRSDQGKVRKSNEDNLIVKDKLYAVADGLGGHRAGEVASALTVNTLDEIAQNGIDSIEGFMERLKIAIMEANKKIYKLSKENDELSGMGTTITCLAVLGNDGAIAHVGDSRAYIVRDGSIDKITDDHSVTNELVKEGGLTEEEAEFHPYKNWLTRALGTEKGINIDTLRVDMSTCDYILLCTDGLTGVVTDEEILSIVNGNEQIQQKVDHLINMANEKGGPDNITVILIDVRRGSTS